jgi:hypothetical protein
MNVVSPDLLLGDPQPPARFVQGNYVRPVRTMTGGATGLHEPEGLAVDPAGHARVSNYSAASVTAYAIGADDDV